MRLAGLHEGRCSQHRAGRLPVALKSRKYILEKKAMKTKTITEKGSHMRTLRAAMLAAVAGGAIAMFGAASAHAAVLSVGGTNGTTIGGYVCADVAGGSVTSGTKVQAWDCHAGPNQQYELSGETIYTIGGQDCLDVAGAGTAPGTAVQSYTCNGTPAQTWYYYNGEIINIHEINGENTFNCLDAWNEANGTPLVVNTCNGSASQTWQIK